MHQHMALPLPSYHKSIVSLLSYCYFICKNKLLKEKNSKLSASELQPFQCILHGHRIMLLEHLVQFLEMFGRYENLKTGVILLLCQNDPPRTK